MKKLIRIEKGTSANSKESSKAQSASTGNKPRITMSQSHAWEILAKLATTKDSESAYDQLLQELPTRSHLTYWLGQIGHRSDVKLGRDQQFEDFLKVMAAKLRVRSQELQCAIDQEQKGEEMETMDNENHQAEEIQVTKDITEENLTEDLFNESSPTVSQDASQSKGEDQVEVQDISRNQSYWISTMKIFADCAVQENQQGVFDVLARNFDTSGHLSWWLWRIGHADKCKYTKRKDIVDAIRKVSSELYRDLRQDIGRRICR